MIRFLHSKVLMDDHGRLLKNKLEIVRYGEVSGPRIVKLDRRAIRSQALSEGDEFVLEDVTFGFEDGEEGSRNFNHAVVPFPGQPENFTGETKRILLSLDIWDVPGGEIFYGENDCEIWVVPTPPQLKVEVRE